MNAAVIFYGLVFAMFGYLIGRHHQQHLDQERMHRIILMLKQEHEITPLGADMARGAVDGWN